MNSKVITIEQLSDCVKQYEKNELMSDFVEFDKTNRCYIFKSVRKNKIISLSVSKVYTVEFENIFAAANQHLSVNPEFSDTIEIFCTVSISLNKKRILKEKALREYNLNALIFDIDYLREHDEFKELFGDEQDTIDDNLVQRALYDYMTVGAESNDIKMELYQSVLLLQIFKNSPIYPKQLIDDTNSLYGRGEDNIRKDLERLRMEQRVVKSKDDPSMIELSDDEKTLIKESLKAAKEEEEAFMLELRHVTEKYKIEYARDGLLALLESINKSLYDFNSSNQNEDNRINIADEVGKILKSDADIALPDLIVDLQNLCLRTDYLRRKAANQSFVDLYKDGKYEEYINCRPTVLFLDTPAFIYYLCYRSSYEEECIVKWDDSDYQSVCDLFHFANSKSSKIQICVPSNYVGEVIGEMKKALRIAWFYDELNIDFPINTSNTLFNFYEYVRSEKKKNGESIDGFTIKEFLSEFGCQFEADDYNFSIPIEKFIQASASQFNFTITHVNKNYELFQTVKDEYKLKPKVGRKTPKAIDNDIRQAFYIFDECNENEQDYYLITWDSTLYGLRDIVKSSSLKNRGYVIGTPTRVLNRLSLKYFRLKDIVDTREVFAYADKQYNIKDKISSLFDNVLSPLFAASSKRNSALVKQLLNLQNQELDKDYNEKPYKDSKLRLENIFISIEDMLPQISCTWQNLIDYLSDEENNDFVYNIVKSAYDLNRDYLLEEDRKKFCRSIKAFVDKEDVDVTL